jgi:hypothetical protein
LPLIDLFTKRLLDAAPVTLSLLRSSIDFLGLVSKVISGDPALSGELPYGLFTVVFMAKVSIVCGLTGCVLFLLEYNVGKMLFLYCYCCGLMKLNYFFGIKRLLLPGVALF